MADLAPVAEDVSAARDAGRSDAILGLHQEVVRDCPSAPMALARDFPWAMTDRGHLLLSAHRYARERRLVQPPQGDWPKVVYPMELPVAPVLRAAPPRSLLALQPVPDGESESS
jgi:hypothetical protein